VTASGGAGTTPIHLALPDTGDDEAEAVRKVLLSGWLTQGPRVAEFEQCVADEVGAAHAVALSSATTGLHLALLALGLGPGDEVIVPSFTWVATANAVVYCGARPLFADVSLVSYNIDPASVARLLSPRTKAVIAVHQFGLCADMAALRQVVPDNIPIIEDAACAAGAELDGRPAGTLGACAVFSFHPRKSMTTGEGGMLTTGDAGIADLARVLRSHGGRMPAQPEPHAMPDIEDLGYNYRMTDIQAAIGIVQLAKLKGYIAERDRWAGWYRSHLAGLNWLSLPEAKAGSRHAWQSFVVRLEEEAPFSRNELALRFKQAGIGTRPGTHAVHNLAYYRRTVGTQPLDAPNSLICEDRTLAIPLHNRMTPSDFERVVEVFLG
jgi:dTDP-4-amino-4,6-dideoxygalactose transaminase